MVKFVAFLSRSEDRRDVPQTESGKMGEQNIFYLCWESNRDFSLLRPV
jgi:hypothetical protein